MSCLRTELIAESTTKTVAGVASVPAWLCTTGCAGEFASTRSLSEKEKWRGEALSMRGALELLLDMCYGNALLWIDNLVFVMVVYRHYASIPSDTSQACRPLRDLRTTGPP